MSILAIDFGGTRIRAAWFSDSLQLIRRDEALTLAERPAAEVIETIITTARAVAAGETPRVIGIAAPGPLDAQRGIVHHAFTLPGWNATPLAQIVSAAFDQAPTFMQNDANLAALAEYELGAAQGCNPTIYLTVSTGIGGGAVIDGQLFAGWRGLAIEPGHMRFTMPDGTIRRLEELASGTGIARLAHERLMTATLDTPLRQVGALTAQAIGQAAAAGDQFAQQVVTEAGQWFGLGLVNLLHLFNPQAIVIGGSVVNLGAGFFDPATAKIHEHILHPDFFDMSVLRFAQLGDNVCLVGAAYYAASKLPL